MRRCHLLFFLLSACAAFAQDTRNVTEPKFPRVCRSLDAQLRSTAGGLAEADEARLDTARIQQAIDGCTPGSAVELRRSASNNAFLSAPLQLKQGITLLIAEGVTLFASRDPRVYDVTPGACGVVNRNGRGCKPFIAIDKATDTAVMGDGTIDGRGGAKLLGQNVSWWDLAQQAKREGTSQNCPRLIVATQADGFILYRITLRNSPNFHVIVYRTNGFTAWGVKINTGDRWARNTDGIDPSSTSNVTIAHSWIRAGDDNVAIKAGSSGPAQHISVLDNHFYFGHGMSIGSETNGGVSDVEVRNLTIDGADNGLRIKSNPTRGGLVHNVAYRDVCIRDTKNPIVMETTYEGQTQGTLIPEFKDVVLQDVRVADGGRVKLEGADAAHPLQMTFDGLQITGIAPTDVHAQHARLTYGPGPVNLVAQGDDVQVTRIDGSRKLQTCSFPVFPSAGANGVSTFGWITNFVVAADGSGDFTSVQAAVDALFDGGGTVTIKPGTYRELVKVTKPNVHFEGDAHDPARVVIVYDNSAAAAGGTLKSATMMVNADDFSARGITIANDFWTRHPVPGVAAQAVALSVTGDRAVFRNVRLLGHQDTLYAAGKGCASELGPCLAARQYFADCYIEGHVDFIFGDAQAYFRDCEIHALARKTVYLTAQSRRYTEQASGYVFDRCRITAEPGIERLFFGRPWRPYGTVVFMNTRIDAPLDPAGWSEWHPGETHSLETATYREFRSTGPGANDGARDPHSRQLSTAEAKQYSLKQFLGGADHWNPGR